MPWFWSTDHKEIIRSAKLIEPLKSREGEMISSGEVLAEFRDENGHVRKFKIMKKDFGFGVVTTEPHNVIINYRRRRIERTINRGERYLRALPRRLYGRLRKRLRRVAKARG